MGAIEDFKWGDRLMTMVDSAKTFGFGKWLVAHCHLF